MPISETAETIHNAGKLAVAEAARLMGDNQRTLNGTNGEDARLRDLHSRVEEAIARERHPGLAPSELAAKEEEVKINIDSPTTVTYYGPLDPGTSATPGIGEPALAPVAKSLLAKAAPLLLAGALGASGGVGVPWLISALTAKPAAEAAKVIDTDTQYILDLVPTE